MTPSKPTAQPPRSQLKTYSHLAGKKRIPTEYEISTSRLLYHSCSNLAVNLPVAPFFVQHQQGSPLSVDDWELFEDPRQTSYTRYTALQAQKVGFVARLFERVDESGYDATLSPAAWGLLARLTPLRYPIHGLQMVAAYVGQIAPAGRVTICCALQAADEVRRIQTLAYRMGQLRRERPSFGDDDRQRWQGDPLLQPLRKLLEQLLVTWDWGEAFTALCLCVKPTFDHWVNRELGRAAERASDWVLGELLASLDEDAQWHRAWANALGELALRERPGNRELIRGWMAHWLPLSHAAIEPLARATGGGASNDDVQAALAASLSWLSTAGRDHDHETGG